MYGKRFECWTFLTPSLISCGIQSAGFCPGIHSNATFSCSNRCLSFPRAKILLLHWCFYCCGKPMTLYVRPMIHEGFVIPVLGLHDVYLFQKKKKKKCPNFLHYESSCQLNCREWEKNCLLVWKSPGSIHFPNSVAQFQPRIWYYTFKDTIVKNSVLSTLFIWS